MEHACLCQQLVDKRLPPDFSVLFNDRVEVGTDTAPLNPRIQIAPKEEEFPGWLEVDRGSCWWGVFFVVGGCMT